MKKLKFAEHLIEPILNKQKYTTWRINDEKDLSGGNIILCCHMNGEKFAKTRITFIRETTFENLTNKDREDHEEFSSDEEMYNTYSSYYGMKITPKTKVKVIRFQLIE